LIVIWDPIVKKNFVISIAIIYIFIWNFNSNQRRFKLLNRVIKNYFSVKRNSAIKYWILHVCHIICLIEI
jgi:hypothetical protein